MQREAQDIFTFFLQRVNWSKVFVRNFKRNASKFDFHVNFTLSFGLKTHLTLNVTNQDKSLSSCRRPNTALLWWKQEIHQAPPLFFFFKDLLEWIFVWENRNFVFKTVIWRSFFKHDTGGHLKTGRYDRKTLGTRWQWDEKTLGSILIPWCLSSKMKEEFPVWAGLWYYSTDMTRI